MTERYLSPKLLLSGICGLACAVFIALPPPLHADDQSPEESESEPAAASSEDSSSEEHDIKPVSDESDDSDVSDESDEEESEQEAVEEHEAAAKEEAPAPSPQTAQPVAAPEVFVPDDKFPRSRPGGVPVSFPNEIYESIPRIQSSASDFVPTQDRWRQFYAGKWYDPYNQNVLKGDIPVFGHPGHEWFFEVSAISDTLVEKRRLPIPTGNQSTSEPNSNNTFGDGDQFAVVENIVGSFALIRGNTTFKPPELELRVVPVFNLNYVNGREDGALRVDPARGSDRTDDFWGFQELFADVHLANITDRYDFISSRVGIQQFNSDFRGFIYNDSAPGARLFGNYDNNKWQFNLAWFDRLDKDANSNINSRFRERYENVFIANVFRQDAPVYGHTMELSVIHRQDTAGNHGFRYDENGFLVRPASIGDERFKNIYSTYVGLTGDGHFGRVNSTSAAYYVFGSESHNQIAQQQVDISAYMVAQELSYDIDYIRLRASGFWASGDRNPFNGTAGGFDTIFDNPNFAGGDLSFWQRQGIPYIGGGGVNITNGNSLVPNFRPGKQQGQSNFVNPGLRLYNVGIDVEVTPTFKLINNASYLQFDRTDALRITRQDGSISRELGWDLSTGFLYRPFLNNNIQFRGGFSCLLPGSGKDNLFGNEVLYTLFTNMILQY